MDGVVTIKILNEFIINTINNKNKIAYFEWDKSFNILSSNNLALSLLVLNSKTQTEKKVIDFIPPEYLTAFHVHTQELFLNESHISTFSYQIEKNNTHINITWLSSIEDNKVLTICCYLQTDNLTENSINTLLKIIPTPALIINTQGEYVGCNNLMFTLLDIPNINSVDDILGNSIGTLKENINLCKYIQSIITLAKPNLIKEVQTTLNLHTGNKVYYLFSYSKYNNLIIFVGLDITNVKRLEKDLLASEERNVAILKALPDVLKASAFRRKDDKMNTLIDQLTQNPIFTNLPNFEKDNSLTENDNNQLIIDKDLYSKLIRLEVETREIDVRLKQIETLIYLGETSFINRLKYIEVFNETLLQTSKDISNTLEKTQNDLEFIRLSKELINITPGGIKVIILGSFISLTLLIFSISYLIEKIGVENTIEQIEKYLNK
jgi:hypothetical protein